jgi:hypothetical protein
MTGVIAAILVLIAAGYVAVRQGFLSASEPGVPGQPAGDTLQVRPPVPDGAASRDTAALQDLPARLGQSDPVAGSESDEAGIADPPETPTDAARTPEPVDPIASSEQPGADTPEETNRDTLDLAVAADSTAETDSDSLAATEPSGLNPDNDDAEELGFVEFRVRPFGDVYIDGRLRLERAILNTIGLPLGRYTVRIQHETYGRWVCDLEVGDDPGRVQVDFDQPVTVVIVAVDSATEATLQGSAIVIDGEATGYTTPMTVRLAPGLHTIEARHDGYTSVTAEPDASNGCYRRVEEGVNLDAAAMNGRGRMVVHMRPDE